MIARNWIWVACLGVLAGGGGPAAEAAAPLEVGVAVVDITPPIGYRMCGYFNERLSTGVHNPLQAKAIALQQGSERCAWVFCDLIGLPAELTAQARTAAAEASGIPREHILIAGTHSHTGPLFFGALRDYFHQRAVDEAGTDPQEAVDYPAKLTSRLVEAITQAAAAMEPAELAAGSAAQTGLAFNRRYVMRDGSVKFNPGKLNPDMVRPSGPIDPQVGLLQFRRGGRPVAGLTVFALHLDTTGGTEYAADYPFFLEQRLRAKFGQSYQSLFGIGTCGNVNHVDVSTDRPQSGHGEAARIGTTLAGTVLTAAESLPAVTEPRLAVAATTVAIPLQQYSSQDLAAARANLAKVGGRELSFLEQVEAVKIVNVANHAGDPLTAEVQAFRLGESCAVVALPGEVFVELGLAIKQASPFRDTIVLELCNDYPDYIPTKRAFAEGSYEPTNSIIAPGGGEMLVEAAGKLLDELRVR
ncbi:MAG: neutral/alkaline non-lysosomal ceramidase N-terminal domain-containing protein [Pirellulales bacterium]|nr:neutral/alkaline non-lysosomal ceramidase N-terminal domain-containing protein [Pirellulales bacterium]